MIKRRLIAPPCLHRQLLNDCGIGTTNGNNNSEASSSSSSSSSYDVTSSSVVSQHRVILFCQMKIMLDIIERDLFKWVVCDDGDEGWCVMMVMKGCE